MKTRRQKIGMTVLAGLFLLLTPKLYASEAVNPVRDNDRLANKNGNITALSDSMDSNNLQESPAISNGVKVAILDSGSNGAYQEGISLVDNTIKDNNGHGTLIASIIKETCPNAELYIVKVIGQDGLVINEDAVILGLEWAISKDVKVINMSLRVKPSQKLHEAIKKAYDKGIILVAAAGNNDKFSASYYSVLDAKTSVDSSLSSKEVSYPAKYPEVIAVGALDQYGKVYNESAQSADIDLYFRGYHDNKAGTSIASAYVTGTVAKVISENSKANPDEIKKIILK
ncbi:MAG: S8 family serine peptidase [Candidatus Omnitrophica bacterium]|nr:S8 family serine peptidase [Candidatus Omnitrophota bacterium]